MNAQDKEIAMLKSLVTSLTQEIEDLKLKTLVGQANIGIPTEFTGNSSGASPQTNPPSLETGRQATKGKQVYSVSRSSVVSDRKYNLVIYGIPECDKGTLRVRRLKTDTINVSTVITNLDSSIHPQCVRDCFRLGKYNDNGSPRPILAKINRSADVSSILSKRGSLNKPISIKPDLSLEDRRLEAILLKERWSLIQSGTNRRDIKIRNKYLFVTNKLYCQVKGSELIFDKCSCSQASEFEDTQHDPIVFAATLNDVNPPSSQSSD